MKSAKYFFISLLFLSFIPIVSFGQQETGVSGLDIAEKIVPFLRSVPEKDNKMIYLKNCEGDTCQFQQEAFKQTRAWVVLAYVGLYNAIGDTSYLAEAKNQMDKLLENCNPNDSDCQYIGVQGEAFYQLIQDKKYLEYLKGLDARLIGVPNRTFDRMLNAIYARQLVLAYKNNLFDDPVKIYKALYLVQLHLNDAPVILKNNNIELKQTACWSYLANTEFYSVLDSMDENKVIAKDLTAGGLKSLLFLRPQQVKTPIFKEFFDNFNFASFAEANKENVYAVNLTELEPCAEALISYYKSTSDEKYKQEAIALLKYVIDKHWDSEYSKKYDGDNAFVMQGCRSSADGLACYKNSKIVTDNAYAAYLFSLLKDDAFIANPETVTHYDNPNLDPELVPPQNPITKFFKDNIVEVIIVIAAIIILVLILIRRRSGKKI